MSLNGGDPRTYKKVSDENQSSSSSVDLATTSSSTSTQNTSSFTTQTTSSTSYTFSSANITSKPEAFNRSANDRGSSC